MMSVLGMVRMTSFTNVTNLVQLFLLLPAAWSCVFFPKIAAAAVLNFERRCISTFENVKIGHFIPRTKFRLRVFNQFWDIAI